MDFLAKKLEMNESAKILYDQFNTMLDNAKKEKVILLRCDIEKNGSVRDDKVFIYSISLEYRIEFQKINGIDEETNFHLIPCLVINTEKNNRRETYKINLIPTANTYRIQVSTGDTTITILEFGDYLDEDSFLTKIDADRDKCILLGNMILEVRTAFAKR